MGLGIGAFIKNLAPLVLYLAGFGSALLAMGGRVRFALLLITLLLPLRNIIDRIQLYPLGNQFIDILLFGVLIGWIVNSSAQGKKFFEKSHINVIAVLLMIYTTFSLFRGDIYLFNGLHFDFSDARVKDWKNFCLFPIIFYLFLNNIRNRKEVKQTLIFICLAMVIECYYTIQQIHDSPSLAAREKISGTLQFLGPNEVAAFFNVYTIVLLSLLYAVKKFWKKALLIGLILANSYCIMFTYSRAAYMATFVGLSIFFWLKDKKMIIPLIFVILFWQTILPHNAVERIKETKTETGELDDSSQRRIDIWQQSFELVKSNPLVGIGFGVFRHLGLDLKDTHNIYVKILTEQGMIGFLIFLILIFCFFREGFQLYQKGEDPLAKALGLGFFVCIFVMLSNNLFGDRWSYLEPNAYLWIFAALVARMNAKTIDIQPTIQKTIKPINSTSPSEPPKPKKKLRYYDI